MKTLLAIIGGVCALAQSTLDRPPLGQMLDTRGRLWPVYGVPGSFVLKRPQAAGIVAMACSPQLCLTKTEFSVALNGVTMPAPRGPALLALEGGDAWLYFSFTHQFARWRQGALIPVTLDLDGQVVALGPGPILAVRRASGVWILRTDGTILDSLPPDTGPVMLTKGATLYATADSLVLRRGASEMRFAVSGVESLLQMGEGLIEARAGAILYAIRIDPGREESFHLPQPSGTVWP